MPSLQVVDAGTPSFGSRLLNSFQQGYDNKKDEQILGGLNPNMSPLELVQSIGKLSKERQSSLQPYFEQIVKGGISGGAANTTPLEEILSQSTNQQNPAQQTNASQAPQGQFRPYQPVQQQEPQQLQLQGQQQQMAPQVSPQNSAAASAQKIKQLEMQKTALRPYLNIKERKEEADRLTKDIEKQITSEKGRSETQNIVNRMTDDLKQNKTGIGISPLTAIGASRTGVRNRNRFNAYGPRLEKSIRELVNPTGALNDRRFDYITDFIPTANDSQQAAAGKLQGLSEALAEQGFPIDISELNQLVEQWDTDFYKDFKGSFFKDKETSQKVNKVTQALERAESNPTGSTWVIDPETHQRVRIPNSELQNALNDRGTLG